MADETPDQEWIRLIEGEGGRVREGDIYPELRAWVDREDPIDILEIGSGQGICSSQIDLENRAYTGIDPSPTLLARAKELYAGRNRSFVLGSAYALPCSDRAFDAAFSVAVWHLLDNLKQAAEELSRVLRPQGTFLIITSNPDAYALWLQSPRAHEELHLHTLEAIQSSLRSAGLEIRGTETFRVTEKSEGKAILLMITGRKA